MVFYNQTKQKRGVMWFKNMVTKFAQGSLVKQIFIGLVLGILLAVVAPDVAKAMEPLYTSKPQLDRSGMGFSFMEAFMDALTVTSEPGHGTTVKMKKVL